MHEKLCINVARNSLLGTSTIYFCYIFLKMLDQKFNVSKFAFNKQNNEIKKYIIKLSEQNLFKNSAIFWNMAYSYLSKPCRYLFQISKHVQVIFWTSYSLCFEIKFEPLTAWFISYD